MVLSTKRKLKHIQHYTMLSLLQRSLTDYSRKLHTKLKTDEAYNRILTSSLEMYIIWKTMKKIKIFDNNYETIYYIYVYLIHFLRGSEGILYPDHLPSQFEMNLRISECVNYRSGASDSNAYTRKIYLTTMLYFNILNKME